MRILPRLACGIILSASCLPALAGAPPVRWIDSASKTTYVLALDEAVRRDSDGEDQSVRIDPPATPSTLAARLTGLAAGGAIFPVAYPDGAAGMVACRRIVTAGLRVASADDTGLAVKTGMRARGRPPGAQGWSVLEAACPTDALARLAGLRAMAGDSADVLLAVQRAKRALPNDPLVTSQWHLKKTTASLAGTDVNIESVWNFGGSGIRGTGIRIGVIDDGVQTGHPDLLANIDSVNDKDWNGNDADPNPGTTDDHGTACAGNAAARGNNGIGVSGTAPEATLVGMRLIAAAVTDAQEAEAMAYRNDIIQVKTNSWGPSDTGTLLEEPGPLTRAALANATATGRGGLGTIILFAGGNGGDAGDNSNYDGYANSIHTIAVGALDSQGRRAYYSERGANLVVCAPSNGAAPALGITTVDRTGASGYNTASSAGGGDYTSDFGGTSSATPTAAGIVALMLQETPGLGWRDVQEILIRSAAKCRPADAEWITNGAGFHFNHHFGAGLIDASAAVAMAATWTNLPAATSVAAAQTGLAVAIPENNSTGITRSFALPTSNLRVEHVTLKLSATHGARGNLAVTLISPSGTSSNLAEVHGDTGEDYNAWTFSSVRHWGESSSGTWSVHIADRSGTGNTSGGTLTALELVIHGTPLAGVNPAPVVQLSSPADGAVFSPGVAVPLAASASDLDANGATGTITMIEFLANGTVVASDTSEPYTGSFVPAPGTTVISARATDGDGATGTSASRAITVRDQVPVVVAATLSAQGQAYADEALAVVSVQAEDPEGATVSLAYQWQASADGLTYSNHPGATTAILPPAAANAGALWRCQITPGDGGQTGSTFVTAAVNLLARPPAVVDRGQPMSYTSGLVLRGTGSSVTRQAILSEISQGPVGGSSEWIEILTLQDDSLAYWDLSDSAGNMIVFLDDPVWDGIPAGTLIVIYNGGAAKDPRLPADDTDPADGRMVISSTNPDYFDGAYDTWLPLGNSGDAVFLSDADANVVHAIAYGNSTAASPNVGSVGSGKAVWFAGGTDEEADSAAAWMTGSSLVSRQARAPIRAAATLPIAFGGPWTSLPTGFTANGLASPYTGSLGGDVATGSAKFDDTGDSLTIEINASAAAISYVLKGNTSTTAPTTGTFVIQTSIDGVAFTTLRTITNAGAETAFTDQPAGTARFVRFLYQSKTNGNIQLDKINVTPVVSNLLSLTISPASISESAGAAAATGTLTVGQAPATNLTVALASADTSEASVPASVVIPAGQTSVIFAVAAVDDADSDGAQTVVISATTAGYGSGNFSLTVTDDEPVLDGVTPGAPNGGENTTFVQALRAGSPANPALFRLGATANVPPDLILNPATGVLAGTIATNAPAGAYTIVIERYNTLGEVVSQSFTLTVAGDGGFPSWILGFDGLADTSVGGDSDADGLPNLVEYLIASHPDTPDSNGAIVHAATGNSLSLTWRQDKTVADATLVPEWSTTLDAGIPWQTGGITIDELENNPGDRLLRASIAIDPLYPVRFLRLRATLLP